MNTAIPPTDSQGYLLNHQEWSLAIAEAIAANEGITLTPAHQQLITFVREYYVTHHSAPAIRTLVKALKERFGPEIGHSLYLQSLFPKGPAKQLSKIAGLPKPVHCI